MKHQRKLMAAAVFIAMTFTACQKDIQTSSITTDAITTETLSEEGGRHHGNDDNGYVYTLSNNAQENKVLVYRRSHNGQLTFQSAFSTGGKGTGSGLGSQGSLTLTEDEDMLLAVNPGSNSISSFRVSGNHLTLVSVVNAGGITPISITQHNRLVYVVNTGGDGNIAGFTLSNNGKLLPIPYSKRPLTSSAAGPAQISFVNDGRALVITEKNENKIISYTMSYYGTPAALHSITSAHPTPFGFATGSYGKLIVSEAAGGNAGASTVSSYRVLPNGSITLLKGPIAAGQTAACWVVLTDNEKYAYATNTGSASVSSFKVNYGDQFGLLSAVAATSGTTPTDAALNKGSDYLYVLNAGSLSIGAYKVENNGNLSPAGTVTGLPAGVVGLAAN